MKTISAPLREALLRRGTSTCFCIKIVDNSGTAYGFTTLDSSIRFNDGIHDIVYDAKQELAPRNIQQEASLETDNTELEGWFDELIEQLALTGQLEQAEVTIYRVPYLKKQLGAELVGFGSLGEVSFSQDGNGKRKVEFRGLTQALQNKTIPLYSLTCRAEFGDERCGMPLVWEEAEVSANSDNPQLVFTVSGLSHIDGYFDLGIIEFLDGDNAGAQMEIETWLATGAVKLAFLAPFPIADGVQVRLRQDCAKTAAACKAYNNIANMRAEHLTPSQERAIMVPGANIKSPGSK